MSRPTRPPLIHTYLSANQFERNRAYSPLPKTLNGAQSLRRTGMSAHDIQIPALLARGCESNKMN
eukprot:1821460-Lingulodinium_polyedra.AAC.1